LHTQRFNADAMPSFIRVEFHNETDTPEIENSMTRKTLQHVLAPLPENTEGLRWQATVPLVTNPLLLLELFQFAFVGAAVVLVTLCVGVWITEGGLTLDDIVTSVKTASVVLLAIMAGFAGISALFFGNRYFAVYHMDSGGIYHEGSRGRDERRGIFLGLRPAPVIGAVDVVRTRSQHLPWDKVDRFQDISSMRVVILRRGFWHLLRLYMPDEVTHQRVVQLLEQRLKRI
jgi:hypothetical protein